MNLEKHLLKALEGVRFSLEHDLDGVIGKKNDIVIGSAQDFPWPIPKDFSVVALLPRNRIAVSLKLRADLKVMCSSFDLRRRYGRVWLVGAGPGEASLMTVKAAKLLKKADIIFYDELVGRDALSSYSGRLIKVGRRGGSHIDNQDRINKQIYEMSSKGLRVVRLKGGDPMIYGRGGEEADFLSRRFVPVEVVPGISAFQAAVSAASIPLTLRGRSFSVTLRTAHGSQDEKIPPTRPKTTVFYMGATRTKEISERLIEEGHAAETPVLAVESAGLLHERFVVTNVLELSNEDIAAPAVILVGSVAGIYWNQERVLYTGRDPIDHTGPERTIAFPISNMEGKKKLPNLKLFDAIQFETIAAVDLFAKIFDSFPNHLLIYASSQNVKRRAVSRGADVRRIIAD